MHKAGPTRRAVLGGVLVVAAISAAACTSDNDDTGQRHQDDDLRARASATSAALADRYAAVIAAFPALAGRLRPLAAEHDRHVQAFGGRPTAPPSGAGPAPSPVPTRQSEAVRQLVTLEQSASDAGVDALPGASGSLAGLVASVSACQAGHVAVLQELNR